MPKPSLDVAQDNLVRTSVTIDGNWLPLSCGLEQIGALTGVGVQLYFTFLKYVGTAFFIWACFQFPLLLINIQSTGGSSATGFAITTAYNLGEDKRLASTQHNIGPEDSWDIPGLGPVRVREMITWLGILDAAGLLVFMVLVGWFCLRVLPRIVKKFDEDNVTPADFSIEISGLPERVADHEQYERQLTEHLVTICQMARREEGLKENPDPALIVVENCLVRDYNGRLLQFQKLETLQKKLNNAREKDPSAKTEAEIVKIDGQMLKLRVKSKAPVMKAVARNVSKRAYVMLDSCENKEVLLNYYRFANVSVFRYFQKPHMRFEGCALKIVEAPEPGNIMWENQDRNEWAVFLRKCFTVFLSLLMFSMSFAIIFAAKAYTKQLQEALGQCPVPDADPVTVNNWQSKVDAGLTLDYCRCEEIGLVGVSTTKELSEGPCKEWFLDTVILNGLILMGAFVVVIVNFLLQISAIVFTKMEQPLNLSSYYSSLAEKIFMAQFFNTGIIILLVNADFFSSMFNLKGGYDDFERQWYSRVGVAIILTMVVQAFSPHGIQVSLYPVLKCVRCCLARRAQTQLDLNTLYTWPDFRLAVRLAGLLNVMFCTMMYSAGLPLLTITATLTFFLVFFCDKFLLLRASRMPPAYDHSILLVFTKLFPLGCLLHSMFAIYMFGNPWLFPSDPLVEALSPTKIISGTDDGLSFIKIRYVRIFAERCVSGAGFANFLVWLLIVFFLVLKLVKVILGTAFGTIMRVICAPCPCGAPGTLRDSTKALTENETTSRDCKKESVLRKSAVIFSYAVELHPIYAGLVSQASDIEAQSRADEMQSRATVLTAQVKGNVEDQENEGEEEDASRVVVSVDRSMRTPVVTDAPSSDEDDSAQKYARATEPAAAPHMAE
eukprot:GEMP01007558.1.p1 GENE.GEMP01007558.1~~GEMP01007558.1.p1  ORF type:complete len:891 (+),score=214.45 GEMP01007558.1:172-2844(+)